MLYVMHSVNCIFQVRLGSQSAALRSFLFYLCLVPIGLSLSKSTVVAVSLFLAIRVLYLSKLRAKKRHKPTFSTLLPPLKCLNTLNALCRTFRRLYLSISSLFPVCSPLLLSCVVFISFQLVTTRPN